MTVIADPEGVSAREIQGFVDLRGKRILEVGCGKGRITFPLAEIANHITAIDPAAEEIEQAFASTPRLLKEKIEFSATGIEDFNLPDGSPQYDLCLFTWSL